MKRLFIICFVLAGWLPAPAVIMSPTEYLGFAPGDDYQLVDYETMIGYFSLLAQQSSRVLVQEIGRTTEARPFYLVIISSADNIRNRSKIIERQNRLTKPQLLSTTEAQKLIHEAPAIVSINCSIHAREIGPSQMSMELAYRLAVDNSADCKNILDHVVLLLLPSHNPDGHNLVVRWYRKQPRDKEHPLLLNQLDHPYVGHDINRDWFMLTQRETRLTVEQVYNIWHPHIVFDLHQMAAQNARMFLPPFRDPYDPFMDPILQAEGSALGMAVAMDMTALGLAGVAHNLYFDSYSPARSYIHHHGGVRILGEIASARVAGPLTVKATDLQADGDFNPAKRSWRQPLVWKPGEWRLADIVAYALHSSLSLLHHAAANRGEWVSNSFTVVKNALSERKPPVYYIIRQEQPDADGLFSLLSLLKTGQVDLYRTTKKMMLQGWVLPESTWVIPQKQPYGGYVRTLLEKIRYDEIIASAITPYDVTAHYMPGFLGVDVQIHYGDLTDIELVESIARPAQKEYGFSSGNGLLIDYRNTQAIAAVAKLYRSQASFFWLCDSVLTTSGVRLPPGTLYADQSDRHIIKDLPLQIYYPVATTVRARQLKQPRLALLSGPQAEMDEGWSRFILDEFGFIHHRLSLDKWPVENLAAQFDAIVIADQSSARLQKALTLAPRAEYESDKLQALHTFVRQGGTLILLNRSCDLAVNQWQLGVQNIAQKQGMNIPGSLLSLIVDVRHPLGYGLPQRTAGLVWRSPVLHILPEMAESIAVYPGANLLVSGAPANEEQMALQTAVASVALEQGRIILFGLQPQFRAQTRATFKLFFNAIIYSAAKAVYELQMN